MKLNLIFSVYTDTYVSVCVESTPCGHRLCQQSGKFALILFHFFRISSFLGLSFHYLHFFDLIIIKLNRTDHIYDHSKSKNKFNLQYLSFSLILGKPLPQVNWYLKDNLTDSSYIVSVIDSKVENEFIIGRLERRHLDQKLGMFNVRSMFVQ